MQALMARLGRFFDVRAGDAARIGLMAAFLFFLLAANNVIKIVRDSLFLSRFPITQLPYVYLLVALLAGGFIGIYSRYTSRLSLAQLILGSHAFIISNVIIFWFLLAFYDFAWVLYAFYMWAGIIGLVVVAQFWTLANHLFTPREGKRLFGVLTAAGTLGGMMGGVVANWAVNFLFGTRELLWLVAVLFSGALGVVSFAVSERQRVRGNTYTEAAPREIQARHASGIIGSLRGSPYLQTIAALIFVSVIVSTLIDYQFKAAAKEAYTSTDALAGFFGSYYAWLSVVTLFAQVWLTARLLMGLGLTPSLLLLPVMVLAGSISLLVWPGLFAATGTRLAEASMRTSVNRSGMEILYLPIPDSIKKKIKVFLDVTIERLGDGTAAFIILFYTVFFAGSEVGILSYFSISFIAIWVAIVFVVQGGYMDALRRSLAYREISLDKARIDYAERGTVEAVLKTLEEKDEESVLFGLELAEKLEPNVIVPRLPVALIHHSSPAVRRQAIKLFALRSDPTILKEISHMLQDENRAVQAEAISAACAIFKEEAIAIARPYLESPDPQVKRRVLECLLRHGDAAMREAALSEFQKMVSDSHSEGETGRVQAALLAGEVYDQEFETALGKLIRDDPSHEVNHKAMAAAAKGKYPGVVPDIILRLGHNATKAGAHDALIEYGEIAVMRLRTALFDPGLPREVRVNLPRTLGKIHSQSAMNALLAGLTEKDRSIRFKVILALEEMARRFPDLKVDREIIESAIVSDVMLYSRRFAIFFVLFGRQEESFYTGGSLLSQALTDSMERVKERVMWLLSLIYPPRDIRRAWVGLRSTNPNVRAHAIEFLDNLLTRNMKRYVFPLFSDAQPIQVFSASLDLIGVKTIDTESALRALLDQEDSWLTAATVWEIGSRGLNDFREKILPFLNSENRVLRETAAAVIQRL
jgi:ATP/ADP translocase/HEAT repeat protein